MSKILKLITSKGARDTYILTAGNLSDSIIAFVFTLLAFRLLTPSDFGLFSAFNNLILSSSLILDFGLSQALLYYLPNQTKLEQRSTVGSAIAMRILIASASALFLALFAPYLTSRFFPGSTVQLILISSLAILFVSFIDVVTYSLQGMHRFFSSMLVANSYSICRLFAILVFIYLGAPFVAQDAVAVTLYGPILGILIALYWLKPSWPSFAEAKKLLGFAGFMGLYRISQIIALRSDVQIVLTTLGASIAGTYSVAARMGNFYPLIIITLNSLFASRLRIQNTISANFLKKSSVLLIVICLLMLLCSWQAPLIIKLLFGAKAAGAGLIYRYLTLAYLPLMAATLPIAILVFFYGKTKLVGMLGVIQVIIMLTGSFMLTPNFREIGPIIALGVANSIVLIFSCVKVIKQWKSE